jgi:hypothetical protein
MPRVREIEDDDGDPILKEIFAKERALFAAVFTTPGGRALPGPILKAAGLPVSTFRAAAAPLPLPPSPSRLPLLN